MCSSSSGSPFRIRSSVAALIVVAACGSSPSLEPGEDRPGGDTTLLLLVSRSQAFTFPANNLSSDRRAPFFSGNAFFNQAWVTAPATTTARDGLGPTYNAAACSTCHARDGRSEPPPEGGDVLAGALLRISIGNDPDGAIIPDPIYGDQLQPFGIDGVPGEGRLIVEWTERAGTYADGTAYSLRVPTYVVDAPAYGPMSPDLLASPRVAPHMIGLGLLEAIPAERLEAFADPDDVDGDGIRGRVQRIGDRIGRFGWKAEQPTVRDQTAGALLGDIGITTERHPTENCTSVQTECLDAQTGGEPEADAEMLDRIAFYSATLAPPARPNAADPDVLEGREIFRDLGCDACHVPAHRTGELAGFPELSNQDIWPYTDLLLHDMGPELSDARPVRQATGAHWRTPPLWGLGFLEDVNDHTSLLHDGRARGFAEAILWHGGEAQAARDLFAELNAVDRELLITFLESL